MAQDDGKITITIQYGDGSAVGNETRQKEQAQKKSEGSQLSAYATHTLLNMAKTQSLKAFNSSIAMIGNLTGEYQKQMSIEYNLGILGTLVDIGESAVSGFVLSGGHVVGALIGAGVRVVGEVVNQVFDNKNYTTTMARQNYEIELLRQRAGLNGLMDGSRGTEN